MESQATPEPAKPIVPRARGPRVAIGLLLAALTIAAARATVLGIVADDAPRDPATSADGIVRQLVLQPDGRKQVRGALVIDRPAEEVWAAVSDYAHLHEFVPHVPRPLQATREADGRTKVEGVVSALLEFPFVAHVKDERGASGFAASWDEPGGKLVVNRGSWTVRRLGADRSLVVYALDVEVAGYPRFAVRYLVRHQLKGMLRGLDRWVKNKTPSGGK